MVDPGGPRRPSNSFDAVVPEIPHHAVQRGVPRMDVFFSSEDRDEYLRQLREQGEMLGVRYLAW